MAAGQPQETAKALLARVVHSYASMSSYQDSGTVKRLRGTDDPPYQIDFATFYKGPSLFRFAFSRPHSYAPLRRVVSKYIVGFDGSAAYSINQPYEKPAVLKKKESLDMAIAGATGISSGSAHTIARLLLREISGLSILDLLDARREEDTEIEEVPCYRVSATYPRGSKVEYTIEKHSLLIRRIRNDFAEFSHQEYRDGIRVNQAIDDHLFAS